MWTFGLAFAFTVSVFAFSGANAADPLRVYAAGSLSNIMPALIAASGLPDSAVAPPVFGPAGVLRGRLLAGEQADLFASADLAQPRAVAEGKLALVVPFARNRMCILAPDRLGITADNLLEHMLSSMLRLATSTPVADPGGDYARAVFKRADALRPGAEALLTGKSLMLLGGPGSMSPQPGHSPAATIFLGDHADALLYYCSGTAAAAHEVPWLVSTPVPSALEVGPVYGLVVFSNQPDANRLAVFMLSERGQAIIANGGLLPIVEPR